MTATALASPRFVRRTTLAANEYRKNFRQIDADAIAAVTSAEADRVTPLMSKIYLRLISTPSEFWEREGVLYFSAGEKDGLPVKASKVLYEVLGVSSATAHKALGWMHEQGIIGYFAGKNGAGIRIFLNRATSSIGVRALSAGKKILPFGRGSNEELAGSSGEPAFNDSYAVLEVSETDLNPRAPKNGAGQTAAVRKTHGQHQTFSRHPRHSVVSEDMPPPSHRPPLSGAAVEEVVSRLRRELGPALESAARRAAAQEHERTREWLESRGLPKAARVAQREAYDVLRRHGLVSKSPRRGGPEVVGARQEAARAGAVRVSSGEARELAETCVAMLEVHGQGIEVTLSQLGADVGGPLLAEDVPRVRELALILAGAGRRE